MADIRLEVTYSISNDREELLVRKDLIGNLELTYKDGPCIPEHYAFVPEEFIPQLIEVLKEFTNR